MDGSELKYHDQIKKEDFADVETSWDGLDALIYTGTLSVGVDFNKPNFDMFVGVFSPKTTTADSFVQSLLRVR